MRDNDAKSGGCVCERNVYRLVFLIEGIETIACPFNATCGMLQTRK